MSFLGSRKLNQKLVVAVVYVCGMLMNSLDSTMVTVAFATLGREFDRTPDEMQGILIGYLVSMAMFIPASGWLGDRFGTKRIFLLALTVFTTGSLLSGMAQSYEMLVATRIIQGAGGGLLIPVGMAMLYRTYPPEERVRLSRILMFALIIGPAMGPLVGGFLVEQFSWHAIFFVNVPVGLAALIFGGLFLEEHRETAPGGFDIGGFVLGGFGLASLMFALNQGTRQGWTSPLVLGAAGIGVALMIGFVFVELRKSAPMVQLRLFKNKLFGATAVGVLLLLGGVSRHPFCDAGFFAAGSRRQSARIGNHHVSRSHRRRLLDADRCAALSANRAAQVDGGRHGRARMCGALDVPAVARGWSMAGAHPHVRAWRLHGIHLSAESGRKYGHNLAGGYWPRFDPLLGAAAAWERGWYRSPGKRNGDRRDDRRRNDRRAAKHRRIPCRLSGGCRPCICWLVAWRCVCPTARRRKRWCDHETDSVDAEARRPHR